MRRVALAILAALTISGADSPAPPSCADEVRDAQARLPQIKDAAHRRELELLLDKAAKDAEAGRERLCLDALTRAQSMSQ